MTEVLSPAVIEERSTAVVAQSAATPADMIMYVMQKGGSIDQLEKFMELQLRWEADQARKAFVEAMAEFKKNPPQIVKDKEVAFSGTFYTHATLGNVTNAIVEGLAKHGFSHRWNVKQEGALIEVSCTITHRQGHSESVSMQAGKDDSGKKNAIQQVASTITYLQRYTLLAATGLATHDQIDDDGQGYDTGLSDKLVGKVAGAKDKDALQAVWQDAIKELRAAGDMDAYQRVKDAVVSRKAELEGGQ